MMHQSKLTTYDIQSTAACHNVLYSTPRSAATPVYCVNMWGAYKLTVICIIIQPTSKLHSHVTP